MPIWKDFGPCVSKKSKFKLQWYVIFHQDEQNPDLWYHSPDSHLLCGANADLARVYPGSTPCLTPQFNLALLIPTESPDDL